MISLHRAVGCIDGASLNNRQQIPLHSLAADVRSTAASSRATACDNLVDFVKKNDAVLLGPLDGKADHLVVINQLVGLLLKEDIARVAYFQSLGFPATGNHLLEHALHARIHFHSRRSAKHSGDFRLSLHLQVNFAVLHLAAFDLLAKAVARALAAIARFFILIPRGRLGKQRIEQSLLHGGFRTDPHRFRQFSPHEGDGNIHEVAHEAFNVPTEVADFGELARFHLHERSAHQ